MLLPFKTSLLIFRLTLLHSERPKLYTILAFLSAIGLNLEAYCMFQWSYWSPDSSVGRDGFHFSWRWEIFQLCNGVPLISPSHCPVLNEILLKRCKIPSHPSSLDVIKLWHWPRLYVSLFSHDLAASHATFRMQATDFTLLAVSLFSS